MTTAAVAGALACKPGNGGEAWVRLSYALGLRRLGCDVRLVEEAPHAAADALAYAHATATRFGLRYSLAPDDSEGADLLINVSGNLRARESLRRFRRTAFVDIDPGYTQIWHAGGLDSLPSHDVYFTIAENIGRSDCFIPSAGIEWRPTRPPVVLDEWPVSRNASRVFTTV